MEREGKDQLPANGRTYLEEMQDAAALRDALAAANAHAEAQAEQMAHLNGLIEKEHLRLCNESVAHGWTQRYMEEFKTENDRLRLEVLTLKVKLWDASQTPAPWNEGTTV